MILKEAKQSAFQNPPQQQRGDVLHRVALQFWYDAGVAFSWVHLVIPAVLALILWGLLSSPNDLRTVHAALVNLELLLPMLAGLFISDTMTREWTEGTADWRPTQPGGPIRLLALRLVNTLILWVAITAVFLVAVQEWYLRPAELTLPVRDVIVLLGPPALYFTGLAVLISLMVRMSLGGLLITAGYWALAWMSAGKYTGPLHVLYLRAPLEAWNYQTTRWWLLAGGILLLALAGLLFSKGERWVR